jgi:drug/metabolite transporter (DMT)-like permease
MNWFLIALAAPFLWGIVNIFDNYLVANFSTKERERSSGGLVLFSSLVGIVIAFLISITTPDLFEIPSIDKILLFITGILTIVWIVFYLFALEIEEVSNVVPWFLTVPIFGYILGYFFLGETLSNKELLGSLTILIGVALVSIDWKNGNRKLKHKPVLYMSSRSLLCASSKYLAASRINLSIQALASLLACLPL